MIYTVTFNPSLDYIVSVNDFRLGATNRTDSELILPGGKGINVSTVLKHLGFDSTALGFIAGLITNYVLSLVFVFKKSENSGNAKSIGGFIIFTVVGLIGLGLTELGMYVGVFVFCWHYLITKVLVAGLVMVWNYVGRKVLVFSGINKHNNH